MSAIVYISKDIPEKNLIQSLRFKAYLSPEEKASILKELKITLPDLDSYIVAMHVEIELKLYDTKNT